MRMKKANKIVVINGTEVKGCTYRIKEEFLAPLRELHQITEFYLPIDMPHFCCGCKVCFLKDAALCPHSKEVMPIWNAMTEAELIVIATPVYGLSISGGLKALFDHFCVRWMVHRPEPIMFGKRAVIMTNCIGPPLMARSSQRDIVNSLSWMGISKIERIGTGLLEGVIWEELSVERREKILNKIKKISKKYTTITPAGKSLKTRIKFLMCKQMQKSVLKKLKEPSADNRHWIEQGWIKGQK